jgi:hypothetical protein
MRASSINILILFAGLWAFCCNTEAQRIRVVDNKGTISDIDTSKWTLSGTNIYNKNSGNVGIGTNSPAAKFHNAGSTILGSTALANQANGTLGTSAALTVNAYSGAVITQTTAGISVTLPMPTNTTAGRFFQVSNSNASTQSITVNGVSVAPNSSSIFRWDGASWNSVTAIANNIPISGLTSAINTNTIDNTNYAQTWNWSTANTQTPLSLSANTLTSGNMLNISSTATGTTGSLLNISSASTATVTNGLVNFSFTGAHTGNGLNVTDVTTTGNAAGITANSLTSGNMLNLSSTATGTTGSLLNISSASTATVTNGLVNFSFTGAHTGNGLNISDITSTGNAANITANSATAGNALNISATSLTTGNAINISGNNTITSGSLIKATGTVTTNTANGLLNIANNAASSTGKVATIQANSTVGSGVNIYANGNVGINTTTPTFTTPANTGASIPTLGVDGTINATNYTSSVQSLGNKTGAFTWDQSLGNSATVTLTGNATLTVSNAKAGMYGIIVVKQDATGSRTLAFGAGTNKVINGSAGVPFLTATASAVDILSYFYDGTTFWWTIGNNYN